VCRQGTAGGQPANAVIAPSTWWCYVDKSSASMPQYNGYAFDYCSPPAGRTTISGKACMFNVRCARCGAVQRSAQGSTQLPAANPSVCCGCTSSATEDAGTRSAPLHPQRAQVPLGGAAQLHRLRPRLPRPDRPPLVLHQP
jgi:hypothetical protein